MSLQVWLPLNGNLNNQGLTNINAINNGATVNASGKTGSCYQFGTAASDITIPKEAMNSFTTEASVCFWIKILTWNTSYATFFQAGPASTPWTSYIFGLLRNNANSTCCFTISNGSSASNASYLTPSLDLNIWYHISLIYKTGHCLIYINGQLYQDYTTSIVPNFSNITTIKLGRCTNGSSYQTNCQMNDFRIYNHALSAKEVEELAKGLTFHYKLDGALGLDNILYDSSGYQHNGNIVGNVTFFDSTPRYDMSAHFIKGSYIRTKERPVVCLPTDAITVNIWVRIDTWGNPVSCTQSGGWNFENSSGIQFVVYVASVGYKVAKSGITPAALGNSWHMLTGTFDKENVKIYIDGVLKTTTATGTTNPIGYANNYLFIGAEAAGNTTTPADSNFVGELSDLRIYCTALTEDQIKELYNTSATIDKNGNVYAREVIE